MIELVSQYLPPDVTVQTAAILVTASLFTSMITAAFGLGGGIAMLAIVANVMPPFAVIPVHGAIQFCSNAIRASLYRRHINWRIFIWFAIGALIGGGLGIKLVVTVSRPVLQLTLGLFVLYSALEPAKFRRPLSLVGQMLSGVATTFATLFVGATGPLVAALLPRQNMAPKEIMGTHAILLTMQHGIKISLFGAVGFAFAPWIWLLAAMFLMVLTGNLLGRALHGLVSEVMFRRVFKVLLVLLAIRLISAAVLEWL